MEVCIPMVEERNMANCGGGRIWRMTDETHIANAFEGGPEDAALGCWLLDQVL
jgi:hypothetical protein